MSQGLLLLAGLQLASGFTMGVSSGQKIASPASLAPRHRPVCNGLFDIFKESDETKAAKEAEWEAIQAKAKMRRDPVAWEAEIETERNPFDKPSVIQTCTKLHSIGLKTEFAGHKDYEKYKRKYEDSLANLLDKAIKEVDEKVAHEKRKITEGLREMGHSERLCEICGLMYHLRFADVNVRDTENTLYKPDIHPESPLHKGYVKLREKEAELFEAIEKREPLPGDDKKEGRSSKDRSRGRDDDDEDGGRRRKRSRSREKGRDRKKGKDDDDDDREKGRDRDGGRKKGREDDDDDDRDRGRDRRDRGGRDRDRGRDRSDSRRRRR